MDDDRFRPLTDDERNAREPDRGSTKDDDDWDPIVPIPDTSPDPNMHHWILGDPVAVWVYRDRNGDRVCSIGRYNKADGDKEFWPRTWWKNRNTGEERWRWKNVPDPRPLYGLELLAQRPNAKVKPRKTPTWFALSEDRPLFAFAGLWTPWRGVRGPKSAPVEGEHELFGFLTNKNGTRSVLFDRTVAAAVYRPAEIKSDSPGSRRIFLLGWEDGQNHSRALPLCWLKSFGP